jgi:hypothetical protein
VIIVATEILTVRVVVETDVVMKAAVIVQEMDALAPVQGGTVRMTVAKEPRLINPQSKSSLTGLLLLLFTRRSLRSRIVR